MIMKQQKSYTVDDCRHTQLHLACWLLLGKDTSSFNIMLIGQLSQITQMYVLKTESETHRSTFQFYNTFLCQ